MRWIFVSLLIASVALFGWRLMFVEPNTQPQRAKVSQRDPFPNVDSIQLLSESKLAEVNARMQEPDTAVSQPSVLEKESDVEADEPTDGLAEAKGALPQAPMSNGKPLCEMVGAFPAKNDAKNFVERLLAIDVISEIKELDLPVGVGYWVYLEPVESRREAYRKLSEIQSRGIDSYVIPKGELANGVSLGVYSQQNLAKERVRKMKEKGLKPLLKEIERTYREVWVMLRQGEGLKMSGLSWERALEGEKDLERRQNFCLDVAS